MDEKLPFRKAVVPFSRGGGKEPPGRDVFGDTGKLEVGYEGDPFHGVKESPGEGSLHGEGEVLT